MQISYHARNFAALFARSLASFRRRGLLATLRLGWQRYRPMRPASRPLELYPRLPAHPGPLARPATPRASVIVPVHDQLAFTLRCLHALSSCGDATSFEVVLVDDASGDDSARVLPAIEGLVYLRNAANLGFIGACNAGAAAARGEYLVFLNNDTVVQPGWLDALLHTFEAHPDTGAAGCKLVFPDGRLQEAGGIVFADGSAANYGRGDDPQHPRYGFVREADYCSGAALALPAALFRQLGGFDTHFAPAYYEDTDLAMRVRERGLKVRYQPASVVVHFEGATSGTDVRQGVKAHQVSNRARFQARWSARLEAYPQPAADRSREEQARAASHRARWRVLVLDQGVPTPDRDSGSVRMMALLRLLVETGCAVTFVDEVRKYREGYTGALQAAGVEAWWRPWLHGVPAWLRRHGSRFDVVIGSRHHLLSPLLPLLRRHAPRAQIVFDSVDLHFLREQREADFGGDTGAARRAQRTRAAELALVRAVDRTWVVSPAERDLLHDLAPGAAVDLVSNIHCIDERTPGFDARAGVVFVGSFAHPPNVDAARWLLEEILPRMRTQDPAIRLYLVGAGLPDALVAMATATGADYLGHVPVLEPLLDRCRVSVAPLRYGAGVKGKVNQALARGLPVVATGCAAEGMGLHDGSDVLLAEDAAGLAAAILRLHADAPLWQRLRDGGFANTRALFSPAAAAKTIGPWLDSLGAKGAARR